MYVPVGAFVCGVHKRGLFFPEIEWVLKVWMAWSCESNRSEEVCRAGGWNEARGAQGMPLTARVMNRSIAELFKKKKKLRVLNLRS